jgi:hypothetical protein
LEQPDQARALTICTAADETDGAPNVARRFDERRLFAALHAHFAGRILDATVLIG